MNSTVTLSDRGCAVLLESASGWPGRAFDERDDHERMVVMRLAEQPDPVEVLERLRAHASDLRRTGVGLGTLVLSCTGCGPERDRTRLELVRGAYALVAETGGRIVLTANSSEGLSVGDLMSALSPVLGELPARGIRFVDQGESHAAHAHPAHQSGTYVFADVERKSGVRWSAPFTSDEDMARAS